MAPLVSCLCVSRPSRWGQLQRAILDFLAQSCKDKELVIVVDSGTDYATTVQAFVDQQGKDARLVRVLGRTAKTQLDGLQYAAVAAYGQILTLWDDDNLNHPTRLEVQLGVQTDLKDTATVLTKGLYYFYRDNELFAVDFFNPELSAADRVLPTTLMAYRESFPVLDHTARSKPSEQLVNNLTRQGKKLLPVSRDPFLHLVGVTCDHLRTYEWHRRVVETRSRTAEQLQTDNVKLTAALDGYKWDVASVSVEGQDGGAFEYAPKQRWSSDLYPVKLIEEAKPEKPTPPKPTAPQVVPPPGKLDKDKK